MLRHACLDEIWSVPKKIQSSPIAVKQGSSATPSEPPQECKGGEAAAARVEAELGPIDVGVNDATVTIFGPVHAIGQTEFRRATEATDPGTVHGTMAALKRIAGGRGIIIQVGSALACRSVLLQAAHCGVKAAIRGFTDSLCCGSCTRAATFA